MADAICRWRNGTPQTVVELVNSIPHTSMPISTFRDFMQNRWNGEFFRSAYQLACQLGLYCEAEDGYYYPRFDHDIDESEAEEYLFFWFPRYYIPNPYTGKDGFHNIECPTYFLKELYEYVRKNPNCTYINAYESCFHEKAINNNDIIRNYINNYSQVLSFSKEGVLNITNINPANVFVNMDRNDRKAFFDNFNKEDVTANTFHKSLQQIFYGAPGTGKSNTIKCEVDKKNLPRVRTTFHPDSDYSTFVGAYKPTTIAVPMRDVTGKVIYEKDKPVTENRIVYEFVPQAFMKAYTGAWKNQTQPFFLIIEEINRGNCAQIFGDLFQLLDRNDETGFSDYPISPDEDIQKFLLTDKKYGFAELTEEQAAAIPEEIRLGKLLKLPKNLHIWATMNTSDQSLFPIDSAFKRRWDWQYMPISDGKKGWLIEANGKRYDWWQFLLKVNEKIGSATNSEDKKLGYFFCKAKDGIIDAETFVSKVVFYIWNDVFKDFAEDAGDLFKDMDDTLLSFNNFYTVGDEGKTKVVEEKVERLLQNLGVESIEYDEGGDENDDVNDSDSSNEKRINTISAVTYQGETFTENDMTQFDLYLTILKKIGIQKVAPIIEAMNYYRKGSKMATKTKVDTLSQSEGYTYVQEGDYYFVKGANPYTLIKILEELKTELHLDMRLDVR